MPSTASPTAILAIRAASPDDRAAVARLAALDSSGVPAGPLLLAIVDGAPLAALSRTTGAVVADPFSPTAGLVELLRRRAELLADAVPAGTHRVAPSRWAVRRGPRAVPAR